MAKLAGVSETTLKRAKKVKKKIGDDMKFKEWNNQTTSLFEELSLLTQYSSYKTLLDDVNVSNLTFSFLYGEYDVITKLKTTNTSEVATILYSLYNDKWDKLYNLKTQEIMNNGVQTVKTVTGDHSQKTERNQNTNNNNSVSAFNSDDYVPNSEDSNNLNDNTTTDNKNNRTEETKSLWAVQEAIRNFNEDFLRNVIFKDISQNILNQIK